MKHKPILLWGGLICGGVSILLLIWFGYCQIVHPEMDYGDLAGGFGGSLAALSGAMLFLFALKDQQESTKQSIEESRRNMIEDLIVHKIENIHNLKFELNNTQSSFKNSSFHFVNEHTKQHLTHGFEQRVQEWMALLQPLYSELFITLDLIDKEPSVKEKTTIYQRVGTVFSDNEFLAIFIASYYARKFTPLCHLLIKHNLLNPRTYAIGVLRERIENMIDILKSGDESRFDYMEENL